MGRVGVTIAVGASLTAGSLLMVSTSSCTAANGPTLVTYYPANLPGDDTTQFPAVDPPELYVPPISVGPPHREASDSGLVAASRTNEATDADLDTTTADAAPDTGPGAIDSGIVDAADAVAE